MEYNIEINNRAWNAIKNKTKEIEVRTNTEFSDFDYGILKKNDFLILTNNETNDNLKVRILRVTHYKNVEDLLRKEGTQKTLSSGKDLEGGIESINSFRGYKEGIDKHGVWAIKIELQIQ